VPSISEKKEERVAIIGAGPAGLSTAYDLAQDGYQVTVFEALPVAGGMLAVAIPEYRLPKDVLKKEIEAVEKLGGRHIVRKFGASDCHCKSHLLYFGGLK